MLHLAYVDFSLCKICSFRLSFSKDRERLKVVEQLVNKMKLEWQPLACIFLIMWGQHRRPDLNPLTVLKGHFGAYESEGSFSSTWPSLEWRSCEVASHVQKIRKEAGQNNEKLHTVSLEAAHFTLFKDHCQVNSARREIPCVCTPSACSTSSKAEGRALLISFWILVSSWFVLTPSFRFFFFFLNEWPAYFVHSMEVVQQHGIWPKYWQEKCYSVQLA